MGCPKGKRNPPKMNDKRFVFAKCISNKYVNNEPLCKCISSLILNLVYKISDLFTYSGRWSTRCRAYEPHPRIVLQEPAQPHPGRYTGSPPVTQDSSTSRAVTHNKTTQTSIPRYQPSRYMETRRINISMYQYMIVLLPRFLNSIPTSWLYLDT